MNTYVITNYQDGIFSGLFQNYTMETASFYREAQESITGNIYVAKVINVVKNLNAAFVDIAPGKKVFLPLDTCKGFNVLNREWNGKVHEQDTVLIQITKDAVKTKDPAGTGELSIAGTFCVVSVKRPGLDCSNKIPKDQKKQIISEVRTQLEQKDASILQELGIILRTNVVECQEDHFAQVINEITSLADKMREILQFAKFRTPFSVLYKTPDTYVDNLKNQRMEYIDTISTDIASVYETLQSYFAKDERILSKLHFYQDAQISLKNLYSLDTRISELLSRYVFLRCGGNLVIDELEAMTVIDVNTAKITVKKDPEAAFFKTNMEACAEIARQLILRNIAGIIMVDFINMKSKENQEEMLTYLEKLLAKDPMKACVVDLTPLGIVEITRKRKQRTFREQLGVYERT